MSNFDDRDVLEWAIRSSQLVAVELARRIYAEEAEALCLATTLRDDVAECLCSLTPRSMRLAIREACGRARAAGRVVIELVDLPGVAMVGRPRMVPGPAEGGQPREVISCWRVYEVLGGRRLVGYTESRPLAHTVRCTSAIMEIDGRDRSLVTASGRIYDLLGKPAQEDVIPNLVAALFATSGLVGRDVTDEILALLPRATLQ